MKNIIIVGGGISGLSLLHYLRKKYAQHPEVSIKLLEKNEHSGGCVQTISQNGCLFETGPNAFLASSTESVQTLTLVRELQLENSLIQTSQESSVRYIRKGNKLFLVPTNPKDFQTTDLIGPFDKIRAFGESMVPTKSHSHESVYDFVKRRFGQAVADNLADPFVSGVYAGDVKQLVLKEAFPRVFELEKEHGSILNALAEMKKKNQSFRGALTSFQNGMSEIINALSQKYQNDIRTCSTITKFSNQNGQFLITGEDGHWTADELYLSTPAYVTANLLEPFDKSLAESLKEINYAPVAVVGLLYPKSNFTHPPEGFGYLIPSSEKSYVLGVLLETNIFPNRSVEGTIFMRVMVGGIRNPGVRTYSEDYLVEIARREIETYFLAKEKPQQTFIKRFDKAIPQYDSTYTNVKAKLEEKIKNFPNLHLVANYLGGISFNDCITQAYLAAQKSCVLK